MKIILGALIGGGIGFGMNYLCKLTGGACPLMSNPIASVIIWGVVGAMVGAGIMMK